MYRLKANAVLLFAEQLFILNKISLAEYVDNSVVKTINYENENMISVAESIIIQARTKNFKPFNQYSVLNEQDLIVMYYYDLLNTAYKKNLSNSTLFIPSFLAFELCNLWFIENSQNNIDTINCIDFGDIWYAIDSKKKDYRIARDTSSCIAEKMYEMLLRHKPNRDLLRQFKLKILKKHTKQ